MDFLSNETFQGLIVLAVVVVYAVRSFLQDKEKAMDAAAEFLEGIVLESISNSRVLKKVGVKAEKLKKRAINEIAQALTNSKAAKAIKKLGVPINAADIDSYIEVSLHAGKIGLRDVLKRKFRALK